MDGAERAAQPQDDAQPARPAPRVLLLEPQPDHAEIVREALELAWPGVDVRESPEDADAFASARFDLVVCSTALLDEAQRWLILAADRELTLPPPVVLIADGDHPARPLAGAHVAAVLDKRNAQGFLERLTRAASSAVAAATNGPPPPVRPPAPAARDAEPEAAVAAPESSEELIAARGYDGGALEEPPAVRDPRVEALASDLARALVDFLAHAAPLSEIASRRAAHDPVLKRYMDGVAGELSRARGMASRLARLLGEPERMLRRPMRAADMVTLRADAWRGWLPDETALRVAADPDPVITVDPESLGPALDDLLLALVPTGDGPCRLDVSVERAEIGPAFALDHPGARPGRYACVRLAAAWGHVPRIEPVSLPALPEDPELQKALAAAKRHGGYLDLGQDPVRGVLETADLYLPEAEGAMASLPWVTRVNILLVDDDPSVRETLAALLDGVGWRTVGVGSGKEAVALYEAGCRYDIVLLDLLMPGLSGAETFRAVRSLDPAARIVILSGSRPAPTLRRLMAEGVLGFLAKPCGLRDLLAVISAATAARPPEPTGA